MDSRASIPCQKEASPFEKELLQGLCRHWICLNHLIDTSMKKKSSQRTLRLILAIGLYRIYFQDRVDKKKAISSCISICKSWKIPHFSGLVSGVLHQHLRKPSMLNKLPNQIRYSIPAWLDHQLSKGFDKGALAKIYAAHLERPRPWVHVFKPELKTSEMETPFADHPLAVKIDESTKLTAAKGFSSGHWQVQDLAMQLMLENIPSTPINHIIDACSAPGGKLAVICKKQPQAAVDALDVSADRLAVLEKNMHRLAIDNAVFSAIDFCKFQPKQHCDLIWVDAPCSGTGVIRKHPEIKYRLSESQIIDLCKTQLNLLLHAIKLTKKGGVIFYSTCSLLAAENDHIVDTVLSKGLVSLASQKENAFSTRTKTGRIYPIGQTHGGFLSILTRL